MSTVSANCGLQNRCISETGRLISDILEITDTLNLKGYLVTTDTEKAFDLLNHSFRMAVLKKLFLVLPFQSGLRPY